MARDGAEEATVRVLVKAAMNSPARSPERGVRRGVVPQRSLDSVDRCGTTAKIDETADNKLSIARLPNNNAPYGTCRLCHAKRRASLYSGER
jgi:hypothetical protein